MIIYFEGVDGVGKSTVMKAVSRLLSARGIDHLVTKEPGGPKALFNEWNGAYPYGPRYEGFRELCVDRPDIPQLARKALYLADALCNWELVLEPNRAHREVLCDRSWLSDLAYGPALTKCSMEQFYEFNRVLSPSRVSTGFMVYVYCKEEERERRLSFNVTNHMDKLGKEIRRQIENNYEEALRRYVPQGDQMWLDSTHLDAEQLADKLVTGLFGKEATSS